MQNIQCALLTMQNLQCANLTMQNKVCLSNLAKYTVCPFIRAKYSFAHLTMKNVQCVLLTMLNIQCALLNMQNTCKTSRTMQIQCAQPSMFNNNDAKFCSFRKYFKISYLSCLSSANNAAIIFVCLSSKVEDF